MHAPFESMTVYLLTRCTRLSLAGQKITEGGGSWSVRGRDGRLASRQHVRFVSWEEEGVSS